MGNFFGLAPIMQWIGILCVVRGLYMALRRDRLIQSERERLQRQNRPAEELQKFSPTRAAGVWLGVGAALFFVFFVFFR